jgi:inhibitor of KinA sporulation pathway (predicted exonuclease)
MMDNNIKFSPATQAVVERLTEDMKQLTTEQLESMIRDILKRDMRELRRKYPEAFRRGST